MGTASLVRSSLSNSSDQQPKGKEKPLLIQTHNAMPMSMRVKRSIKIKSPTAANTRNGIVDRFQISAQFKTSHNVFRSLDRSSAEKMPKKFDDGVYISQTSANVSPAKMLTQRCEDNDDVDFVESVFQSQLQPPRTA